MIKVVFIDHRQQATAIDVPTGSTLMQAAVNNDIAGIVGECGGYGSCATCVCQIAEDWADRLPAAEPMEQAMLESVLADRPRSRLSCQIELAAALDGLTVHLPESQY